MRIIIHRSGDDRTIEMHPDGSFASPPATPIADRILRWAIVASAMAAMIGIALLALWAAMIIIPIAIASAAVTYAAWRWRVWRRGG